MRVIKNMTTDYRRMWHHLNYLSIDTMLNLGLHLPMVSTLNAKFTEIGFMKNRAKSRP